MDFSLLDNSFVESTNYFMEGTHKKSSPPKDPQLRGKVPFI